MKREGSVLTRRAARGSERSLPLLRRDRLHLSDGASLHRRTARWVCEVAPRCGKRVACMELLAELESSVCASLVARQGLAALGPSGRPLTRASSTTAVVGVAHVRWLDVGPGEAVGGTPVPELPVLCSVVELLPGEVQSPQLLPMRRSTGLLGVDSEHVSNNAGRTVESDRDVPAVRMLCAAAHSPPPSPAQSRAVSHP
jgi:hypothetical protein